MHKISFHKAAYGLVSRLIGWRFELYVFFVCVVDAHRIGVGL